LEVLLRTEAPGEARPGGRTERKNEKEAAVPRKLLEPITPGEILLEEFMKPLGVSINKLARDIDVPPGRISEIVNGSGPSRRTRRCGWAATSASRPRSG
jgi:hypothetical protein